MQFCDVKRTFTLTISALSDEEERFKYTVSVVAEYLFSDCGYMMLDISQSDVKVLRDRDALLCVLDSVFTSNINKNINHFVSRLFDDTLKVRGNFKRYPKDVLLSSLRASLL